MSWELVIGLEVHIQLATASKIFSGSTNAFGAEPNTQANAIDLGLPGVLPVLNEQAVHMAIKFGLAVAAEIPDVSIFARKNYFYPDLPKGYQISQYEHPIVGPGHLDIQLEDGSNKRIGITRAHLEEDAGKSLHDDFHGMSGIDLNRAGTPLLEIVSEPDMRNAKEAVAYLKKLHAIVRYLQISDGNMQEGSFRCDANVSVRPKGQTEFGTRTEIKNLNSFRFIEKAINFEAARHIDVIERGGEIVQETRLYDPDRNETRAMRSKEEANDYRYFPDPDLLPVRITADMRQRAQDSMPELPAAKQQRFIADYQLPEADAEVLVSSRDTAEYFEDCAKASNADTKQVANWVISEVQAALNKHDIDITQSQITAAALAQLLDRIADNTISGKIAKDVFQKMWDSGDSADSIIEREGLKQMSDTGELSAIIDKIITDNPAQVEQFKSGKDKVFGFFVGQVMKATQGKANPQQVNDLLRDRLQHGSQYD